MFKRLGLTVALALGLNATAWAQGLNLNNFGSQPVFLISNPTNNQSFCYNSTTQVWANGSCGGGGGGGGTVTTVTCVAANGFSCSIANPTTTPAITLSTSISGPLKGSSGALAAAGYSDIVGLFSGTPSSTCYLSGSGACSVPPGGAIPSTTHILQGNGTGGAADSGYAFPLALGAITAINPGTDVSNCTASTAAPAACSKALSVPSSSFQGLASVGSNIATRQAFFGQTGTSAGANYTFGSQIAAEAPFEAVKLIFVSYSSSYNIGGCTVSPTAVLGSNGTSDTWTAATFSTGKVGDLPPTYAGTTATFTVPAPTGSGDNLIPGWAASDWISVSSIARTDGGTLPLLAVRCWMTSGTQFDNQGGMSAFNALSTQNGRVWWTGVISDGTGAYVSAPASNAFAPSAGGQWVAPIAVQFAYTNVTGLSLVTVGDSLTRGQSTGTRSTILTPYAQYAVNALSTTSRPITLSNMGWSGQSHDASYRNTLWAINNLQPDVILFSVNSVNDGTTDFSANRAWNHALAAITQAKANGIIPIIVTEPPSSGWNSTTDAYRVAVNNKVRALAGAGVYVLDADSIVTTGANPGRLQAGYDSGDGLHPNAAGYAAIGTALQTILTTILNGR